MKKKFLPGLVIALAMSSVFGSVSMATDIAVPVVGKAADVPPSRTMAVQPAPISGGWTKFRTITAADIPLFQEAIPFGVQYEPLAVRTQVVAGTNYDFFCNAKVVAPGTEWYQAMVQIFSLSCENNKDRYPLIRRS
jgi:hypothetical protein